MKVIEAYQTSDGQIFTNSLQAIRHERKTEFKNKLTELIESQVAYTENQQIVLLFIMENINQLSVMFNDDIV